MIFFVRKLKIPPQYIFSCELFNYFVHLLCVPTPRPARDVSVEVLEEVWDGEDRVDRLVGNSHFIAEQIQKAYGRDADVVFPFVDLERFEGSVQIDGFARQDVQDVQDVWSRAMWQIRKAVSVR